MQSENSQQNDESRKVRCQSCRGIIEKGATKCIHCDSYQNWRRHINVSSTVLALLVALISVLTTSIPIIKNALVGENSDILVIYQNYEKKLAYFTFIGANSGSRPGGIREAFLLVTLDQFDLPGGTALRKALLKSSKQFSEQTPPAAIYRLTMRELDASKTPFFQSGASNQMVIGESFQFAGFANFSDSLEPRYFFTPGGVASALRDAPNYQADMKILHRGYTPLLRHYGKCKFSFETVNFDTSSDIRNIEFPCTQIKSYFDDQEDWKKRNKNLKR